MLNPTASPVLEELMRDIETTMVRLLSHDGDAIGEGAMQLICEADMEFTRLGLDVMPRPGPWTHGDLDIARLLARLERLFDEVRTFSLTIPDLMLRTRATVARECIHVARARYLAMPVTLDADPDRGTSHSGMGPRDIDGSY